MATFLCREFVRDLIEHNDANFASRVLSKIIGPDGGFEADADDHRFRGIEDGWIRYVSRQNTAYRAIFLRRGEDVYWYRAGSHSIENRLQAPQDLFGAVAIGETPAGLDALMSHRNPRYLKTSEPRLLREVIASRVLVPQRNACDAPAFPNAVQSCRTHRAVDRPEAPIRRDSLGYNEAPLTARSDAVSLADGSRSRSTGPPARQRQNASIRGRPRAAGQRNGARQLYRRCWLLGTDGGRAWRGWR